MFLIKETIKSYSFTIATIQLTGFTILPQDIPLSECSMFTSFQSNVKRKNTNQVTIISQLITKVEVSVPYLRHLTVQTYFLM